MIDPAADAAPNAPIPVPIMKPYRLPTFFIRKDAGIPASMVPIKWNERGRVANAWLSEILKPMSGEAETVRLLVVPVRAKQRLNSKIVLNILGSVFGMHKN